MTADIAWREFADKKERETVWRRDRSGTPDNKAIDESFFRNGYRIGAAHLQTEQAMHAAWRKRAEEAEAQVARLTAERDAADASARRLAEAIQAMRRGMADGAWSDPGEDDLLPALAAEAERQRSTGT